VHCDGEFEGQDGRVSRLYWESDYGESVHR